MVQIRQSGLKIDFNLPLTLIQPIERINKMSELTLINDLSEKLAVSDDVQVRRELMDAITKVRRKYISNGITLSNGESFSPEFIIFAHRHVLLQ